MVCFVVWCLEMIFSTGFSGWWYHDDAPMWQIYRKDGADIRDNHFNAKDCPWKYIGSSTYNTFFSLQNLVLQNHKHAIL